MNRNAASAPLPITENYIIHRTYTEVPSELDSEEEEHEEGEEEGGEGEEEEYFEDEEGEAIQKTDTNDSANILSKLVKSPSSQLNSELDNEPTQPEESYINYKHIDETYPDTLSETGSERHVLAASRRSLSLSHITPRQSIGETSSSQDLQLQSSPTTALSFATGIGTGFTEMPLYDYGPSNNACYDENEPSSQILPGEEEEGQQQQQQQSTESHHGLMETAKRSIFSGFGSFKKKKSPKSISSIESIDAGGAPSMSRSSSTHSALTGNRRKSMATSPFSGPTDRVGSPEPTLSIDHASDVATLLSEVLDSDDLALPQDVQPLDPEPDSHTDAGLSYPHSISSLNSEAEEASDHEEAQEGEEEQELAKFLSRKKQYFILSTAGKPIYSMHGSDELVTGYMGVFQAIVSYFEDDSASGLTNSREGLQVLRAGNTMFVFAIEDPIILIAIDKLGQTELQLRAQLDLLYAQILSTLTKSQLSRVFKGRANFDLRPLLSGSEVFMNALTKEMSFGSPGVLLGALECLRLRKSMRAKMHHILSERRSKSLLYGLIVADSRLVAVIRPRKHSLHPPDLHLVFSMLFNTQSFSKGDGEHWVPICLPKFNATGFLYAYIHFFAPPQVALVLISADKGAFFELQAAKDGIVADLNAHNLITPILSSLNRGRYRTVEILGTPHLAYSGAARPQQQQQPQETQVQAPTSSWIPASSLAPFTVRHFLYKSRQNVQFVMPSFDPHYMDTAARHRLMILYHQLHGALHGGSRSGGGVIGSGNTVGGGTVGLRVYHVSRGDGGVRGSALAWLTPAFELYCVTGSAHEGVDPETGTCASLAPVTVNTKDAMLRAVKTIVGWIKSHEERLFIFGGAVF